MRYPPGRAKVGLKIRGVSKVHRPRRVDVCPWYEWSDRDRDRGLALRTVVYCCVLLNLYDYCAVLGLLCNMFYNVYYCALQ